MLDLCFRFMQDYGDEVKYENDEEEAVADNAAKVGPIIQVSL